MRIKNKKIDEFFKKLPVSKNYETKIILNRAFFAKRKRNNTACIAPFKKTRVTSTLLILSFQ